MVLPGVIVPTVVWVSFHRSVSMAISDLTLLSLLHPVSVHLLQKEKENWCYYVFGEERCFCTSPNIGSSTSAFVKTHTFAANFFIINYQLLHYPLLLLNLHRIHIRFTFKIGSENNPFAIGTKMHIRF